MLKQKYIRVMGSSTSMNSQLKGQLSFLNESYDVIAVGPGGKHLETISERENIKIISLSMEREISIFKDIKSLFKLIKILNKEKPYIVHGSSPKGALLSMLASWICRVPHRIYTVTGLRFETTKGVLRKLLIYIEKINCFCATKIIPEGNGVKKTIIKERITNKELNVILNGNINGVDISFFNPKKIFESKDSIRDRLGIDKDELCFIFIGRIVKDKGINELINAFSALSQNNNLTLLLLGEIEKTNEIEKNTLGKIKSNTKIKHIGYVEDIRPYLKASDVFVLPSYREGFPNVLLQAGAMCLPSIATDISGCNEIIVDGDSGRLIQPQNLDSLKFAMDEMILLHKKEPQSLLAMGKSSRMNISNKFEQAAVWQALLVELKKCNA